MKSYITIDGGTTNTRVSLVTDGNVIQTIKISAGAKSGIDDKTHLEKEIKAAVDTLTQNNDRIEKIIASGMITSEFGLYNLPHIHAPAGIGELHTGMYETVLPQISEIPFVFIPGVKTGGTDLEQTDMMRGEETELIGMAEHLRSECMYVLPGSHSKLIKTDKQGRIAEFATALTGEMIFALSQGTILKSAVELSQTEIDDEYLISGYKYCDRNGINEALFKTRILKNSFHCTPSEAYSFFMGTVLQAEIKEIIKAKENTVIIGGKEIIKKAMIKLLHTLCKKEITGISAETVDFAPAIGAIKIYEYSE